MYTSPATLAVQARRVLGALALSAQPKALRLIDRAYARYVRRCEALAQAEQLAARNAAIIAMASRSEPLDRLLTEDLIAAKAVCTGMTQFGAAQHLACELRRRETFARCMAMGPAAAPKPRYIGTAGRVGHTAISTGRQAK